MIALARLCLLLLLQLCGEGLARLLSLPIPGPVIGMLLLSWRCCNGRRRGHRRRWTARDCLLEPSVAAFRPGRASA